MARGDPETHFVQGKSHIHLPVDQDFVRVFREGGHLTFSIAEPEESLHAIFRPFVLAALLTRPQTSRSHPSPRHHLRSVSALDLVASFTPMDPSKDKWVESDKVLATKLLAAVEDARKSTNLRVQARPVPVLSSGTGFSQYFQGPLLSPSTEDPAHRDLFAIFQTRIPRYLLLDESRERSAAHHYWSLLHPLQLARDLATVTDSTVFTVKQEGLRSLPLPTLLQGIQGAVSLTFDHLEDVCVRSLTKAVQAKVKIRELMLGAIKPHTLRDPLLHSDLLRPDIFPPSALNTALPFFKTALDTSSIRDHADRLPFQAPRSELDQGFVPRGRRSRRGANRYPRSLPTPASHRPPSTSDDLRGGVLSDLRRQVADLRAQIGTTASPSPARISGRGHGSAPPRDRSARRGRNFFRGNAGRSRGRAGSHPPCSTFVLRTLSPTLRVSGEAPTLGAVGNLPDSLPNGRGLRHFRPRQSVGAFIGHGSRILCLFVSPRPHSTNLLFGTPSSIGSARVWSFQIRLSLAFSPICSQSLALTTDPPPVSSSPCPGSSSTSSLLRSLLDNHRVLARLLTPPAFLTTLDISEAYTHIPMRPNLYRYLAFSYLGQLYFFHALPFGLNVAPYIFTQVLAWPLHCLRARGISLLAYLDDIVVWHRDRDTLLAQVQQVMVFLQDMGFRLNLAKSQPYPSPSAVWLGVHWLPQTGRWHLPVEGQEAIRRTALALLRAPLVTRRQLERLVGVINFACQVHRFLRPFLQPLTKGGTIAPSSRTRHTGAAPPSHARGLDFLDVPDSVVACSQVPLRSPVPLPLDGRFTSRVGCLAATVAHGFGRVVARRTSPPCQRSGAPGYSTRPTFFRPPTPVSPHLHRQRVGSVHLGGVPHKVAGPPEGVDRAPLCAAGEGPDFPSAPRTYGPQRRCRRSQPRGAYSTRNGHCLSCRSGRFSAGRARWKWT